MNARKQLYMGVLIAVIVTMALQLVCTPALANGNATTPQADLFDANAARNRAMIAISGIVTVIAGIILAFHCIKLAGFNPDQRKEAFEGMKHTIFGLVGACLAPWIVTGIIWVLFG